jgi:hypothetical protein
VVHPGCGADQAPGHGVLRVCLLRQLGEAAPPAVAGEWLCCCTSSFIVAQVSDHVCHLDPFEVGCRSTATPLHVCGRILGANTNTQYIENILGLALFGPIGFPFVANCMHAHDTTRAQVTTRVRIWAHACKHHGCIHQGHSQRCRHGSFFWPNFLQYHPLTEDTKYYKGVTYEEIRPKNRTVVVGHSTGMMVLKSISTRAPSHTLVQGRCAPAAELHPPCVSPPAAHPETAHVGADAVRGVGGAADAAAAPAALLLPPALPARHPPADALSVHWYAPTSVLPLALLILMHRQYSGMPAWHGGCTRGYAILPWCVVRGTLMGRALSHSMSVLLQALQVCRHVHSSAGINRGVNVVTWCSGVQHSLLICRTSVPMCSTQTVLSALHQYGGALITSCIFCGTLVCTKPVAERPGLIARQPYLHSFMWLAADWQPLGEHAVRDGQHSVAKL